MQQLEPYFQALFDSDDLLQTWRKRAWDRLQEIGLPVRGQEAYQYVPLQHASLPNLAIFCEQEIELAPMQIGFQNGFFQGAALPAPLVCLPLQAAMRTYGIFLQNRFLRSLKEETDPMSVLNGALHGKGAFLYVPPNVQVAEPILIRHHANSSDLGLSHLQVFLGKGASLSLMQQTEGNASSFMNLRVDVSLDEGASLFFGDDQTLSEESICFRTFRSTLKKGSMLKFFSFTHGSKLARSSIKVQLLEENSSALLQGLSMLDGKRHAHTHAIVEHVAPHCISRQHFKGVLKEESSLSFEGKILVLPIAQKTESYQLTNNLLFSDKASVNAKPNLEIFADDVKASHGATIAQVSEEDLFYLRSRGIEAGLAKTLLTDGFCQEILQSLPSFFRAQIHKGV